VKSATAIADNPSRTHRRFFVMFCGIKGREGGGRRMKEMIDEAGRRPCWFLGSGDGKYMPNPETDAGLPTIPLPTPNWYECPTTSSSICP